MNENDSYCRETSGGISINEALRILWARVWLVLATVVIFGGLALVASMFMQRIYRGETLLAIVDMRSGGTVLAALTDQFGINVGDGGLSVLGRSPDEYIAMLTSRRILNDLIVKNQLKQVLFRERFDAASGQWNGPEPTLTDAYQLLIKDVVRVNQDRTTRLVTVACEWQDPVLAAQWSSLLVDAVNETARAGAAAEAERSLAALRALLANESIISVRETIARLIEGQLNALVAAKARDQFAFRVIDPAIAADKDKYVRPRVFVMVFLGMIFGFFVAAFSVVVRARLK